MDGRLVRSTSILQPLASLRMLSSLPLTRPGRSLFLTGLTACLLLSPRATLLSIAQEGTDKKETTICIEAEQFQFPGSWGMVRDRDALGHGYLGLNGTSPPAADALTAINLPRSGKYHLWTRAREYKDYQPGTRSFQLTVDGVPAEKESGGFREADWLWQKVGTMELAAGEHMLGLRYTRSPYGRCDAIVLTTGSFDPNKLTFIRWLGIGPKLITAAQTVEDVATLKADGPTTP